MVKKHPIPQKRLDTIFASLQLCNKVLSELNLLNNIVYSDEESDLLSNFSFKFYKVTLLYCYNNEYLKLLEEGSEDDLQFSSISKLNKCLLDDMGDDFYDTFKKNETLINSIIDSKFYKKQIDINEKVQSERILSYEEVQTGFEHLLTVKQIIMNCISLFEIHFDINIPNHDTNTVDFIMDYSVFKKFYYKNYMRILD